MFKNKRKVKSDDDHKVPAGQQDQLVDDSDASLAPWGQPGRFVVGYVDEVNGPGALAVPEFVASRHELHILLRYWLEVDLKIRFWWFCTEQVGSDETRRQSFAVRRINRIAAAVNDDAVVQAAIREVEEAFGKKEHPAGNALAWKVFMGRATPAEQAEFRVEQNLFLHGGNAAGDEPGAVNPRDCPGGRP